MKLKPLVLCLAAVPVVVSAVMLSDVTSAKTPLEVEVEKSLSDYLAEQNLKSSDATLSAGSIMYHESERVAHVQDVSFASKKDGVDLKMHIDDVRMTYYPQQHQQPEVIFIPDSGYVKIDGIEIEIPEMNQSVAMKHKTQADEFLAQLAGESKTLTSNYHMTFEKLPTGDLSSVTKFDMEAVGDAQIDVVLSNIYPALNGKRRDDPKLSQAVMSMGVKQVNGEITTSIIPMLLKHEAKESGITPQDFVLRLERKLNSELEGKELTFLEEKLKKQLVHSLDRAVNHGDDIAIDFTFGNINFGTVMGFMSMGGTEDQSDYIQTVFGFDANIKAQ